MISFNVHTVVIFFSKFICNLLPHSKSGIIINLNALSLYENTLYHSPEKSPANRFLRSTCFLLVKFSLQNTYKKCKQFNNLWFLYIERGFSSSTNKTFACLHKIKGFVEISPKSKQI